MKKFVAIVVYVFCAMTMQADGEIIRVGVYNFPPLVFIDESKGADGFFIDILEYIADEEGWDLEYVPGSWSECLDRLRNNVRY